MKKWTLGILAVVVFGIVGCGKSETVVSADGTKVTATENGATTTVSDTKGNSATIAKDGGASTYTDAKGNSAQFGGALSEADLGMPFYPGSTEKPNASMKSDADGQKSAMSTRTSKDDPDKVVAFYKDKITDPKTGNIDSQGTKMGTITGKLPDGAEVSVIASRKGTDDTDVTVTVVHKKA